MNKDALYRRAILLAGLVGFALGATVFWAWGIPVSGYAIDGDPLQVRATFYTPATAIVVTAGIGTAIIAYGFLSSLGESWKHVLVLSAGVGFLLTGLSGQMTQRIKISPESFTVQDPWQLSGRTYQYADVERLWVETRYIPWSRTGRIERLHYTLNTGENGLFCRELSRHPIWGMALPYLQRGKQLAGGKVAPP